MLQILTSDFDACPADILAWLKSRWREENFLKYASENYGIDKICDYAAAIEANTKIIDNPARKKANTAVRDAEKAVAAAERALAALLADPAITAAAKNTRRSPPPSGRSPPRAGNWTPPAARDTIPAKLPANLIDPEARAAVLRTGRRGLQMVLRLLAHNAEHWLANHLNAYLRDDDEYRAITRQTIIRGLAGTITYTPAAITVHLRPARHTPRRPGPGPAHRRDQRHAARHTRRHPAHHLPAPPTQRFKTLHRATSGDLGPVGEPDNLIAFAPRKAVSYYCHQGHVTPCAFLDTAKIPKTWQCRCGQSAGLDESNPPPPERFRSPLRQPDKSHLQHVKERRSADDGEALIAWALDRAHAARLRHREKARRTR